MMRIRTRLSSWSFESMRFCMSLFVVSERLRNGAQVKYLLDISLHGGYCADGHLARSVLGGVEV